MSPQKDADKSTTLKAMKLRSNCPAAKKCGGCSFAGKTYFEQTIAKEKRVVKGSVRRHMLSYKMDA